MLRDGWRFMRDFLYVDNQHGAPWDDVWAWYSAWLPDVEHRSDFNHLLDMLSGEIAVGHSYVRGGDYPELTNPRTGLLGADLSTGTAGVPDPLVDGPITVVVAAIAVLVRPRID